MFSEVLMIQFINRCNTFSLPRPAQNNTTLNHNIDSSFNEYLEKLKKPISKENNNYSEDDIKYKKTILGQIFTNYNLSDSVDLSEIDLQNVDVNDIIYNIKPFLIGNHVITNILLSINSIDDKYSQQKIQLAHDIVGWLRQEKDILSLDYQVFEILSHSLYTTDADISEYVTLSCNKNSDEEGITPSEISLSNTTKPEENISTITGVLINLVMDTVMYMTGELIIPEFNKLYTGYNIYNKLTLIYQDPESGKTEKLRQLGYQLDKIAPNISSSDIKKYIKLFSSLLVDTTIIWDKLQNLYQQDSLLQSITETLNSVSLSIKKTSLTGNQLSAQWSNIANILHLLANGLSLVNNLCSLPENSTAEHYFDLFFKSTSLVNSMQPLLDLGKSLSVLKNYPCQGSSAEQLSWLLEGISNPELSPYIEPVTGKAPLAFIKSAAEFPANGTLSEQIESAYHLLGNMPGVSTFSSAFRENLYIDEITHLLTMLIKISKGEECYTILTSLCTTGEGKNILSAGLHSAASMAIPYMGPIPQFLNSGWQLWNSLLSNQSWSDITKNILSILTESLIAPMTDPLGERTLRLAQAIAQHNSWEETITHIILQGSNAGEKDINFYKQYLNLLLGWKIYQAFQESDPDKLKSQLCHISFELKKLINVPEWTYLNTLIDFIPLLPALQKADISIPMQNENLITWANRMLHTLSNSTDLGIVTLRHDLSAQITKWTAEALIAGFSAMISGAVSPDQTQKKAMPSPAEGWGLSDIAHGTSHWLVTVDKTLDNAINSIFPWKVVDASPLPETTPNSETAETVIDSEQFSVSNHNLISDVDKTGIDHIQDTYNDIITLYDGFILDFLEENEEDEINNPWRQYAEYTLMGTWWAFVAYKTLQTCKKNKYTETLSADTPLTVFSTNGEGEQSETLLSLPETTKPNKTGIISQYKTPLMMAAAGIFIPGLLWYLRSESSGAKEKDFPKIQLSDEEFNALSAKLSNDEKELFEKTAFNHAPEHHIQKRVVYHDLSYTYRDLQYIQENTVPVHLTLGNFIHRMEEKHKITIFNSLNKIMVKRFIYDNKTDSGRYHEDISLHRYLITGPGDSVEQHINYKLPSTLPERLAKDLQQYHRRDQKRIRIAKDLYRKLEYTERRIVSEYKNDFPGFIRYLQRRHHLNDFINKSSYVTYYEEGTINEKKCSLEDALTKIDRNHVIIYERWFYHPKFRILIKYFEYFREIYEQKNNLVKKKLIRIAPLIESIKEFQTLINLYCIKQRN